MSSAAVSLSSSISSFCRFNLVLALLCAGCWWLRPASAQTPVPAVDQTRRSYSGQFIISAVPPLGAKGRAVSILETNREYLRLDPTLVPVSCERMKQILSRQLGLGPAWAGRIFLALYSATSADDPVTITCAQFRDGWQYRVDLPDVVDRFRFVRAIVQTLLLESANRTATEHSADIPAWLSEGLAHQIILSSEMEVILPPPQQGATAFSLAARAVNARKENPLEIVHKELCSRPPLSFQQLSWPDPEQLEGEASSTYRCSAHLFVNELLRLDDGRACFRAMLAELARHYNWQFAFLHSFRGHFQRPLDVEKWWALRLEHFTGRELAQTWTVVESWQRLDELIRSAVQVRAGTNEMPLHAEVKLQTIVGEWDRPLQDQALREKMRELEMARLRLATEFVPLADEYRNALGNYLQTRNHGGFPFRKKAARQHAVEQTLRQLEKLDARRLELKPSPPAAPVQARNP